MINKNVEKIMNEQIVHELYSAYLYLAMSAYFESINLKGAAHWMRCQAQEEEIHAMLFYKHIVDRMGKVVLGKIDAPPASWKSPLEAFVEANKHEQKVTALINNIAKIAMQEADFASNTILQWFTNEQIEEEAQTDEIAQQLKLVGDNSSALLLLDQKLLTRIFTYPATLSAVVGGVAGGN
ncbi:ferritin [candidate division WOR-1 bacterium RIFOXYA12_FULL_43_27]|uniref:Ferritin n=1 Tax=candidate division WOR-1 bacterium RIFOXYC2_FULL_46_14 TaxID=1802587 RepID=A0A1F4U9U7_UNCSA|nr:MAG: ferritin [candidate division WOR-1 bacterium RIFOXYA12_FULL_43_27]OGC19476.1 MAG: ferritin [candidate division WOR-1 bacterium RIFOXYB2_FULL_46_45]OGC30464.1 MAG: ferritin [candidate division WOR-1 bacterium RIFOXYA2_FULL_46_56]OGC41063.1 MAG: ferritin [candidate division WOR-1 bacterium RIFOXYC2_FULL_46_14]